MLSLFRGRGTLTAMPDQDPTVIRGRAIVATGGLQLLRERLGLTRSAMAELLHTSGPTYSSWERRPEIKLWPDTAARIGRFYDQAWRVLDQLEEELDDLIPFHVAATQFGLPQEILLRWYRDGQIPAVDLGILGPWLHKDDLHKLAIDQDYS